MSGPTEFVAARQASLLRLGWLLTGDDESARDLVQEALARTLPHWSRISGDGGAERYVRRVMVNLNTSWWRRRMRRGAAEVARAEHDGRDAPAAESRARERTAERLDLSRALAGLPARQRAAVVLRFYEDLSEAEVASVMNCSVGTVKSQTSKALAKLRLALPPTYLHHGAPDGAPALRAAPATDADLSPVPTREKR